MQNQVRFNYLYKLCMFTILVYDKTKKCNIIIFFSVSRQILGQYLEITKSSYMYNQPTSFIDTM